MSNLNISDFNENSFDNILKKINNFEEQNDSYSGNKNSVSNYNDYLDLIKKNVNKNLSEEKSESLIEDSKILSRSFLNNTILNQSNNFSFNLKYNLIEELSKEYDIEEEDEPELEKWENEKILNNPEYSFISHKNILLLLDNKDNNKNSYSKIIDISINNNFFDLYYKKLNNFIINDNLDLNEEFFEINIKNENFNKTYYCNHKGIINSNKNTIIEEIIIGRENINNEIIPYDIGFNSNFISKIHCEIITKYGFQKRRKFPKFFLLMLKNLFKFKNLDKFLVYKIFDFLKPPKKFFLRDLKSKSGTYNKIKKIKLKKNENYIIGEDLKIIIQQTSCKPKKKKCLDFINYIILNNFNDILFIGIEENLIENLKNNFENLNSLIRDYNFIIFEIITKVSNIKKYLFIFSNNEYQEYTLGRIPENDICLNIDNISRNHCKIIFNKNKWFLNDNNSLNGIWNSILNKRKNNFNDLYLINENEEIKIQNYFITFNFYNLK